MGVTSTDEGARRVGQARDEARAKRRAELLDAAVELVRREGPFVSMEQIAAECGITKPIIYRHFGDRDGLIVEMAMRFVDQLADALTPALGSDAPVLELLVTTMDSYLDLIERDTNLYRFLTIHTGERRDLVAGLIAEHVGLVMERILTERGLDTSGVKPWAYGLVGLVHFAGDWWVEQSMMTRAELIGHLVNLVWIGFEGLGVGDAPPRKIDVSLAAGFGSSRARAQNASGRSPSRSQRSPQ
ncbi:MAG: TetR/AcrR family transcriptional regulator [Acidimicrobiales bacterium]|nr:TetR/AcrR family transcriptional regulator [Acidimicrobiales bacterium]